MIKLGFSAQEAVAMNGAEMMGYLEAHDEILKGPKASKKAYVIGKKQPVKAKAAGPGTR